MPKSIAKALHTLSMELYTVSKTSKALGMISYIIQTIQNQIQAHSLYNSSFRHLREQLVAMNL